MSFVSRLLGLLCSTGFMHTSRAVSSEKHLTPTLCFNAFDILCCWMPLSIESPTMTVLHSFLAPDIPLLRFFSSFDYWTFANLSSNILLDSLSSSRTSKLLGCVYSDLVRWSFAFSFEIGNLVLNIPRHSLASMILKLIEVNLFLHLQTLNNLQDVRSYSVNVE